MPQVSVVFWEICVCVCVCLDRQNPQLALKTLQNQNIWGSYDTLEKTIIRSFAGKASIKRKGLQTLRPLHHALSARGLMCHIIRGKPYMCNCVLHNATWSLRILIHLYLSIRAREGLNLKFDISHLKLLLKMSQVSFLLLN